ncbi:MAG: hypothetical protein AAF228_04850 [Pseudomonadota bacterium]
MLQTVAGHFRTDTTTWNLLQWAYGRQKVRYAGCGGYYSPAHLGYGKTSITAVVCKRLELGDIDRGNLSNGTPSAHPDAEHIHDIISHFRSKHYWMLVNAAEVSAPPQWDIDPPEGKLKPVLKKNGKPKMIVCPVKKRPIACRIEFVGYSDAEREKMILNARAAYETWWSLLSHLTKVLRYNQPLKHWKITGIGAKRQPWNSIVTRVG